MGLKKELSNQSKIEQTFEKGREEFAEAFTPTVADETRDKHAAFIQAVEEAVELVQYLPTELIEFPIESDYIDIAKAHIQLSIPHLELAAKALKRIKFPPREG